MKPEAEAWLVVRRDHDGNLDLVRMPDGVRPAWELTETEADEAIAYVQRTIARCTASPIGS